jgi:hypothetical protein
VVLLAAKASAYLGLRPEAIAVDVPFDVPLAFASELLVATTFEVEVLEATPVAVDLPTADTPLTS